MNKKLKLKIAQRSLQRADRNKAKSNFSVNDDPSALPLSAGDQQSMNESSQGGSFQKALNSALRILTRRDHTILELSQKLKLRNFGEDIIHQVLSECERLHYLDDERTSLIFLDQLKRKGYGSLRIRHEFRKKGLGGDRFEKILKNGCSEDDDRVNAKRVLLKKMNSFDRETDDRKRKEKMYRFLNSRGFPDAIISELLRKYT